jgi:HK97 family phage major capsid protein
MLSPLPSNGRNGGVDWSEGDLRIVAHAGAVPKALDGLSKRERDQYSIRKLILGQAGENVDMGLEREVSATIESAIGRPARNGGMFVPTRLRPQASGLDTKTNAAGKYTVATEVRDVIELLRNKTRVIQLGATVLGGLQGNLQFPTQASAGSLQWTGENPGSDVTQTDMTFGARSMTPKTAMSTTAFSRQMLAQSTIDVENFVRLDIAAIHALGIDLAAINGSGTSNQPLGILKTTGIGSVSAGASGAAPTYGKIVELETAIASANADTNSMGFLTSPVMRGRLRKVGLLDSIYASIPLWDSVKSQGDEVTRGELIGYTAMVSNQVPQNLVSQDASHSDCHAMIFGSWNSLIVGEWGILELVVDPFSLKRQGMIEVTSFQLVDVLLRQPAEFAACLDFRNV